MSIDNITAKILNDAKEYANELLSEANKEAEIITAKAESEANAIKERMAEQAIKDAAVVKHRKHSAADLEGRKERLAAKQKAVSDAVDAAISYIADMNSEEYTSFLVKKISETNIKEGQLLLNAKDRDSIGDKLIKAANESLKDGKLTLSDETISTKGGFVLRYGTREINSSLETMVHAIKEDVTSEVVSILFHKYEGSI